MFKVNQPLTIMTDDEAHKIMRDIMNSRVEDVKTIKRRLDKERADNDGQPDTVAIISRLEEQYERAVNEASALAIATTKF